MNGTWDDLTRRLTGAMIGLDLDDSLIIGDRRPLVRSGLFGAKRPVAGPRRFVQVTAARDFLIGECVGSKSFGGVWAMSEETEGELERLGWERPWSPEFPTYQRQVQLSRAPGLARILVRSLQTLGSEMSELEVELVREEPGG